MTSPTSAPGWLAYQPTLLAPWDARGETPEALADRLARQLRGIDTALGSAGSWAAGPDDVAVDVAPASLEALIRAGVYVDDVGTAFPDAGYSLSLSRRTAEAAVVVWVSAGSSNPGRRLPANKVSVKLFATRSSGVAAGLAEHVLLATVEAWDPPAAAVRDTAAAEASGGRGRWAPVLGQRTWISRDLGVIGGVPPSVRTELTSGGTLLAADDSLSADVAVAVIWDVLVANGIVEIPHGPARG